MHDGATSFVVTTADVSAAPTPRKPPVSAANNVEFWMERYAKLRATYDAARTTDEFKNIWANADRYDADSAHSKDVRHTLISRSRYEINNNGFSDGIAQTRATHLVGTGPVLRMQSGSEGFNRMVELQWHLWTKAVHFRRKLWCMAHAKHSDGEAFARIVRNPRVRYPVPLDITLVEAEQVQTPFLPVRDPRRIDGMELDEFGNPVFYEILREHPGSINRMGLDLVTERVPAEFVLHWFKMRRPGQHRGVPESASTLNVGAAARRYREANLSTAEKIANFTLFLKTLFQPDELHGVDPMSTFDMQKGLMTALPNNVEPIQLKAEHPPAGYAEFNRTLINEQARAVSMPYNVAACDSSSYNYASGRLDHQTYYGSLDIDREDANDLALDPLFDVWFRFAVRRFGWLGGNPDAIGPVARSHVWDWPKHRVADIEAEANANRTKLESGQTGLYRLYSDAGMDAEDELEKEAQFLGVPVAELKKRITDVLYPPVQQGGAPTQPTREQVDELAASFRRNGHALNGNGATHG